MQRSATISPCGVSRELTDDLVTLKAAILKAADIDHFTNRAIREGTEAAIDRLIRALREVPDDSRQPTPRRSRLDGCNLTLTFDTTEQAAEFEGAVLAGVILALSAAPQPEDKP